MTTPDARGILACRLLVIWLASLSVATPDDIEMERVVWLGKNTQGCDEVLWLTDSSVMVRIPSGSIVLGGSFDPESDEKPSHKVSLDSFFIDKYETTNRQYRKFCDATGHAWPPDPGFPGLGDYFQACPDYPVVGVTWDDARAYCEWAGKRLPTEAQWERAARASGGGDFPWGTARPSGERCNFADVQLSKHRAWSWCYKNADDGYPFTAPVGSFPSGASPYGVEDMAGNAWEWCADWYSEQYAPSLFAMLGSRKSLTHNPSGPQVGRRRVVRGGGWDTGAKWLRSNDRHRYPPSFSDAAQGFRCAH